MLNLGYMCWEAVSGYSLLMGLGGQERKALFEPIFGWLKKGNNKNSQRKNPKFDHKNDWKKVESDTRILEFSEPEIQHLKNSIKSVFFKY